MDDAGRRIRDRVQNLLITLLAVSAALLLTRTQLFRLGISTGGAALGLLSPGTPASSAAGTAVSFAAPVRLAVTGDYWRHGSVTLTTEDEAFAPLGTLLGEALGSAGEQTACGKAEFEDAVDGASIYCDFLNSLPLPVLAGLLDSDCSLSGSARQLVLSARDGSLYLWDGGVNYSVCDTSVPADVLETAMGRYDALEGAVFAGDSQLPHSGDVQPYSLFIQPLPQLPVLTAQHPAADTDALLAALQFNPRTNSRYMEATGAEVIVESERSMRIYPDGLLTYQGGDASPVTLGGGEPAVWEAVTGAKALLQNLTAGLISDAQFYPESVLQAGKKMVLRYGYQVGGVPIRFSDGTSAAEVTLNGGTVTALSLRLRGYTAASEDTASLLPLEQALAIAALTRGRELSIGYTDNGETVSAGWLAD